MRAQTFTYPKTAVPTSSLVAADLSRDRIEAQVAACVLQGIVNRQSEQKIYVANTYCYDNLGGGEQQIQVAVPFLGELFHDIPAEWLSPEDDRDWGAFLALLNRFRRYARGLVVWDPRLTQATIEAATTIAGQTDAIAVSPRMAEALGQRGLPVVEDLRERQFGGNVACVTWLLENWLDGANRTLAFTWSHMTTDGRSWGAANKDYVVANRLFTFYLDVHNPEEAEHFIDVLARYPQGTPVMGWADEIRADPLFRRLGYFMVPCISVENLTVQSSFPSVSGAGRQPDPRPAEIHENGVYAAIHVADGDNLLHSLVYMPGTIMRSGGCGEIPATWIINPGLVDLAPRLFEWYMGRLDGHELGAMMSDGHAGSDRYTGFSAYCAMARQYMKRSGTVTLKQMAESEAVAWNVRPYVLNSGYRSEPGDGRGIGPYECHMDGETLHLGSVDIGGGPEAIRELVRNRPPGRPLFLNLFGGTAAVHGNAPYWSGRSRTDAPARYKEFVAALKASEKEDGCRYFFLRSKDLAATYRKWRGLPVEG